MRCFIRILAAFIVTLGLLSRAHAFEPLNYGPSLPVSAKVLLSDWVSREMGMDLGGYAVAMADLNRDGIAEYVLKPLKCYDPQGFCTLPMVVSFAGSCGCHSTMRLARCAVSTKPPLGPAATSPA